MPDAANSDLAQTTLPEIVQVVFLEVSAKRLEAETEPQPTEVPLVVQVAQPADDSEIMVRVSTDVTTHQAVFRVDVAARFTLGEPAHFTDSERIGFSESGPLLTLIPFVREALLSSASRLGVDGPMVPLIRFHGPSNGQEPAPELS